MTGPYARRADMSVAINDFGVFVAWRMLPLRCTLGALYLLLLLAITSCTLCASLVVETGNRAGWAGNAQQGHRQGLREQATHGGRKEIDAGIHQSKMTLSLGTYAHISHICVRMLTYHIYVIRTTISGYLSSIPSFCTYTCVFLSLALLVS